MKNPDTSIILIDSHVHLHDCYGLNIFFDSVFNNFSTFANKTKNTYSWSGFLLLTEMKKVNYFKKLQQIKSFGQNEKYTIQHTEEDNSLRIISPEGNKIFIIAGRQIIAEDNIEVLALCTNKEFEERQSLLSTIKEINTGNGIAVLPWGVGKWTGKRKEIIKNFLVKHKDEKFYLGDNSGRPTFWSEPDLFKLGNATNHFVLPGTDALSISTEVKKTASYGFYIFGAINESTPTKSIKNIITHLNIPPKYFGKSENPISFFKNQFKMQLLKYK